MAVRPQSPNRRPAYRPRRKSTDGEKSCRSSIRFALEWRGTAALEGAVEGALVPCRAPGALKSFPEPALASLRKRQRLWGDFCHIPTARSVILLVGSTSFLPHLHPSLVLCRGAGTRLLRAVTSRGLLVLHQAETWQSLSRLCGKGGLCPKLPPKLHSRMCLYLEMTKLFLNFKNDPQSYWLNFCHWTKALPSLKVPEWEQLSTWDQMLHLGTVRAHIPCVCAFSLPSLSWGLRFQLFCKQDPGDTQLDSPGDWPLIVPTCSRTQIASQCNELAL